MRDQIIHLKLDEENKKIVERAAAEMNLPVATFTRMVLLQCCKKNKLEAVSQ